ncbi:MAG: hypothetical protein NXY57DRAFT_964938 [Lentinula lateritia]|nr:MAG: hypothetical protein NXY57DRAFT_964938 [Lentinula lateritia]
MAVVVFISRVFPIVRFSILSFVDYVPESCEAVSSLFDLTEAQSFPGHELSKAEYITANSHGITSPIERERSTPTPTSALISAPPLTPLTSPSPSVPVPTAPHHFNVVHSESIRAAAEFELSLCAKFLFGSNMPSRS